PSGPMDPIFGHELTAGALDALRARIRADPRQFVAQERVEMSTVPSLAGLAGPGAQELTATPFWMRSYAVAEGDGYKVMPGALSQAALPGESKDTWVLSSGPVQVMSLLPPPSAPVELSRDEA